MPVYKDEKRNTWYCKCNYKDWLGESKSKMKRGFATKKDAQQPASKMHPSFARNFGIT
ncbi:MAG: Arm DNA-binding domain-containing protein [Peribacillus sp.]